MITLIDVVVDNSDGVYISNMGINMAFMAFMKASYTTFEIRVTMTTFVAELILTDPTQGIGETVKKGL